MPDVLPIGKQNSEGFRALNIPAVHGKRWGCAVATELDLFLIPVFNKLRLLIL